MTGPRERAPRTTTTKQPWRPYERITRHQRRCCVTCQTHVRPQPSHSGHHKIRRTPSRWMMGESAVGLTFVVGSYTIDIRASLHEALSAVRGPTHFRPPDHRLTLRVDRPSTPSSRATIATAKKTTDSQEEVTSPPGFPSHRKNGPRKLPFIPPRILLPTATSAQDGAPWNPTTCIIPPGTAFVSPAPAPPVPSHPQERGGQRSTQRGYHYLVITTTHQILTLHDVPRRLVRASRRDIMPDWDVKRRCDVLLVRR